MKAVAFDDRAALDAVIAAGFGGWGPPCAITQERVVAFERVAGRDGRTGVETAPGAMLIALMPRYAPVNDWQITGHRFAINLGASTIRFPAPVPVGASLRGRSRLAGARPHARGMVISYAFDVREEDASDPGLAITLDILYSGAAA